MIKPELINKPKKKASKEKSIKAKGTEKKAKASGGDQEAGVLELEGNKRVSVREFKGMALIDIREYYKDKASGDLKPGKKGIALTTAQWEALKEAAPAIDKLVEKLKSG